MSRCNRNCRRVVGAIFIVASLCYVFFTLALTLQGKQFISYEALKPGIVCELVEKRFPGESIKQMAYAEYQYWQLNEFNKNVETSEYLNQRMTRVGAWSCFCQA